MNRRSGLNVFGQGIRIDVAQADQINPVFKDAVTIAPASQEVGGEQSIDSFGIDRLISSGRKDVDILDPAARGRLGVPTKTKAGDLGNRPALWST